MLFLWTAFVLCEISLAATGVFALRRGGPEERLAAIALLTMAAASQLISLVGPRWRSGPEYGVLACDVVLFVVLLVVVHRSRKFWPLWAAAAQLAGTLTHGVRWLEPSLTRETYASVQPFWVFPIMAAIVVGVLTERAAS